MIANCCQGHLKHKSTFRGENVQLLNDNTDHTYVY